MKISKTFLLSAFITAAILMVVGGVTAVTAANRAASQKLAAYEDLVQQANDQITRANEQILALQGQTPSTTQPASPDVFPLAAPAAAVTAGQAEAAARSAVEAGQILQKPPELVSFEGAAAYEVVFSGGSVFIDAQSGAVLFNGTAPQTISAEQAAQVASDYLHNTAILETGQVPFRGQSIYRVIFKNGTIVFLDPTGQIISINLYTPPGVQQASVDTGGGGGAEERHDDDDGGDDHDDDD